MLGSMDQDAPSATPEVLPLDCLRNILGRLASRDGVRVACTTSKLLVLVGPEVAGCRLEVEASSQLQAWPAQDKGRVTSIALRRAGSMEGEPQGSLRLTLALAGFPCLEELTLRNVGPLHLGASAGGLREQRGLLGAVPTRLTRLALDTCWLADAADGLVAALALPSLCHLCVTSVRARVVTRAATGTAMWPDLDIPEPLLAQPGAAQLTGLELESSKLGDKALGHLSRLTALRDLSLQGRHGGRLLTAQAFTALSALTGLTRLRVACASTMSFNARTTPGLGGLTSLQHLALVDGGSFGPELLERLGGLSHLQLDGTPLVGGPGLGGAAVLLRHVAGLAAGLTHLGLRGTLQLPVPKLAFRRYSFEDDLPDYGALTAGPHLRHLDLSDCRVPAEGWAQMFEPSGGPNSLRHLSLPLRSVNFMERVAPGSLQDVAASSRQLRSLHLACFSDIPDAATQVSLEPLSALTGLTALSVSSSPRGARQWGGYHVTRLTGLKSLRLTGAATCGQALVELLAMKQLTFLSWVQGPPADASQRGRERSLRDDASSGVWQQLLDYLRCLRWDCQCDSDRVEELVEELQGLALEPAQRRAASAEHVGVLQELLASLLLKA